MICKSCHKQAATQTGEYKGLCHLCAENEYFSDLEMSNELGLTR